jgi:hypothetical protein
MFAKWWSSYKWRFAPYAALRMSRMDRRTADKNELNNLKMDVVKYLLHMHACFPLIPLEFAGANDRAAELRLASIEHLGFDMHTRASLQTRAGRGVFVRHGRVRVGQLAQFYPGTFYAPYDPILLPSLANAYILRCVDGAYVDGKARALSASIHRSCVLRDRIGCVLTGDMSWMHDDDQTSDDPRLVASALHFGHIVNNASTSTLANVSYEEVTIMSADVHPPIELWMLRRFLPYAHYSPIDANQPIKVVALMSRRSIDVGEELYSDYFTLASAHPSSM